MAPVKFDDIPKVATSIINDDYQVSGYVLKTKQKTGWHNTSVSGQVDFFAHDAIATPSKITLAMPKPFGCTWFMVNKLEMDKAGKFKLEASKDNVVKGLKVEVKSDLVDINKATVTKTYTGIKDVQAKWEAKMLNAKDFTFEATYSKCKLTCGTKLTGAVLSGGLPEFGARYLSGPFFCSLMASKNLSSFDLAASYKATPEVTVAAIANATSKGASSATVGLVCKGLYKVKASTDGSVSFSAKKVVSQGFSVISGLKYSSKGALSYGCQVSLD